MRKTLLTLLASAAIVGSAHAASALWKRTELWTVTGHTGGYAVCTASARFNDGTALIIAKGEKQWSVSIAGLPNMADNAGTKFPLRIAFDFDQPDTVVAEVLRDGTVFVGDVTNLFLREFATSSEFHVEGDGSYDLTGSAEAIRETIACQSALSESRLSRVWEPKPTDQGV